MMMLTCQTSIIKCPAAAIESDYVFAGFSSQRLPLKNFKNDAFHRKKVYTNINFIQPSCTLPTGPGLTLFHHFHNHVYILHFQF